MQSQPRTVLFFKVFLLANRIQSQRPDSVVAIMSRLWAGQPDDPLSISGRVFLLSKSVQVSPVAETSLIFKG